MKYQNLETIYFYERKEEKIRQEERVRNDFYKELREYYANSTRQENPRRPL